MLNSDIRDHAYQFFIEEAPELLSVIEMSLLELRGERTPAQIHGIMRAAHSIKGGAASVQLPAIEELAHRLEDIFKALYNDAVVVDETMEGLLLECFDHLKQALTTQIETGQLDHSGVLEQGLPVIAAIEEQLGDYLAAGEQFLPSSADLGVDIVASLFEVDIAQGLAEIRATLAGEDQATLQATLSAQTEIFAGLAEILNLPGFKEITDLVAQGLGNPEVPIGELAAVAVEDWQQSCGQVLDNGDRQQGGEPSDALVALVRGPEEANQEEMAGLEDVFGSFGAEEEFFGMDFPELGEIPTAISTAEENVFAEWSEEPTAMLLQSGEGAIPASDRRPSLGPERVNLEEPAYRFFIEEAPTLLQEIETGLLTIGQDRSAAVVHGIMRAAHSLKGGAASVGLETIKHIAHRLEDIFKALYNEEVAIDQTMETLLLQGFDCLRNPLEQQIDQGYYDPETAWQSAQGPIVNLEQRLGGHLAAGEQFLPSSADLGVDVVASVFEVDIAEGIAAVVAAQHQGPESLREVLTSRTEIFLGLAEILNLPGFQGICAAVQQALAVNPEQLSTIATQALADWQAGVQQVLENGDRQRGGEASAALLALGQRLSPPAESRSQPFSAPAPVLGDLFFGDDEDETEQEPSPPTMPMTGPWQPQLGPEASPTLEQTPMEAETVESPPSLEEVFGGLTADVVMESPVPAVEQVDPSGETLFLVQAVEEAFDSLPPVATPAEPIATPKKEEQTPTPLVEHTPERRAVPREQNPANLSIRVDFQRLERMNNWVGELAINRNSLSLQNQQLQTAVGALGQRFGTFQAMALKLRQLADQLAIRPEGDTMLRAQPQPQGWLGNTFDSLEMDSYGTLSAQLQEILEEMMQLEEAVDDVVLFSRAANQTVDAQKQMLFSLRDELMWARMLPLGEILQRFPRLLRDMASKFNKPVQIKLHGTAVLVDRLALEKLYDPLLHLLRNAFDHGIEDTDTRLAAGKPATGTIEIHAYHQGNQTIIEMRDDGGGLNGNKILQRAVERGLITQEQGQRLSTEQINDLIFEPNFSTADQVSELSGRGVGLDVVRQQLQALKGTIVVSSRPGRGTVFSLRLPLTLTIAKLLVCLVGQDQGILTAIAIPSDSVAELMVPTAEQLKTSGGQRFLHWQQLTIPIYSLAQLLPYQCPLSEQQTSKLLTTVPQPDNWHLPLVLLRLGQQYYALEVNRLVTEQELVIKPFAPLLPAPSYLYGATILADGTLIPVVNGALLLEWHWQKGIDNLAMADSGEEPLPTPGRKAKTILVVDDSAALRRTLAFTLERSGYRVMQAKDGQEALKTLAQTGEVDLIICDVEMPNLNGFEFLGQRRRNADLLKIPVAMLTSRGSDKHRQLAKTLGANAYFTKPYIEQQFLGAVQELLAAGQLSVSSY
ncbi:Hpt domain-containing protein [Synechocystis sp. PCC 7338]|uniref:hybrid sensor histidine kinase/response regulator n=1 Tax=Synechocystis sp. PCC 7338 TaxID=2732530 RepID=UPI001BB075FA|nr:Hpt domain-containing protein [Synechocystis sp. PCC 7338]QUS60946.1 Hpt domain-containing protein [Synechocystis sp. PCC 7338]